MAKKSTSWEYRIYLTEENFDNCLCAYSDAGLSKREAIWEAKRHIKRHYPVGNPIIKIQTDDREKIEMFIASNRFGEIIFTKWD